MHFSAQNLLNYFERSTEFNTVENTAHKPRILDVGSLPSAEENGAAELIRIQSAIDALDRELDRRESCSQ